jgi:monoamine oxidase
MAADTVAPWTRRAFLERLGQTGGVAAVDVALGALGLGGAMPAPPAFAASGRARPNTRVIVLGAGLSGLAAAWELQKLGYEVDVLEARARAGGRCFSIRRGTASEETGRPKQVAAFDESLYLNAGPARIPHHHATTLEYCRMLGVSIEMFCSVNEAAYVHQAASTSAPVAARRLRLRQVRTDWRGHTAELLAKAVTQDALDTPMSAEDRDRLVDWLRREGPLSTELRYTGSARRGYAEPPGAGDRPGRVDDPLGLDDLLRTGFGPQLTTEIALQMPMFQAVGGMDRIAAALASRVTNVHLGAEVQAIEQPPGRVRVRYRDASGASQQLEAPFAVCTLPLPVLREIAVDVAPAMRDAMAAIAYASAGKIGLQFKRRFWEEDDGIYGGITRTDLPITQILYPSTGFLSRKGILVGYYQNGAAAAAMGELTPADRLARALEQGAQIHPQYPSEFETAFSVAWQHVPHSRGGWAQYTEAQRQREYRTIIEPDRGLYLCGDHTTYQCGWMIGAFESARRVVSLVHERASREAAAGTASASH